MREYEVMLILPAEADEALVGTAVDRITKSLADSGGAVTNIDRWGRRRFAFEIDDRTEGYYVVVEYSAEPSSQVAMERVLTLADEILRFKVVVRPPKQPVRSGRGSKPTATSAAAPVAAPEAEAEATAEAQAPAEAEPEADEDEKEASPAPA